MLYVGKATAKKLEMIAVNTIGNLSRMDIAILKRGLGKWGEILWLSLFDDTAEQLLVQEQIEKTVDMLRYRFGHDAIMRASALLDTKLTGFNPKEDHTIHPYSYFR